MSTPNVPPLFLLPAIMGVRSRRHLVVIRRAEAHVKTARNLIVTAVTNGELHLDQSDEESLRSKVMLIEQAVDELERYIKRRPQSSILARLAMVTYELDTLNDLLEKRDQVRSQ